MKVDSMIEKRNELEGSIIELIAEYQKETGLMVSDIRLEPMYMYGEDDKNLPYSTELQIEVKLP